MDYYQGVVVDYLRSDRAIFVNPECIIQLKAGERMPAKNESWVCDAVAVNMCEKTVFLCEVTYAVGMVNLIKRLKAWNDNWEQIRAALNRDCGVDPQWKIRPWLFIPNKFVEECLKKMRRVMGPEESWSFKPRVTTLESVQPWMIKFDHRDCDTDKSGTAIPESMWS